MEENNADECESPDDTTDGYCAYCCSTPGCNAGLPPYPTEYDEAPDLDAPGHHHDSHHRVNSRHRSASK
nr:hypothetical protein BaRGS_013202 [Batillaria attramentaria]